MPTARFPRLNGLKEHSIELAVNQITVDGDSAVLLDGNVIRELHLGKGLVHVIDLDSAEKKPKVQVVRVNRSCPSCGTSVSELDPRLVAFNSKPDWCEDCFCTAVELEGFDEEQSGEETAWNEWMEGAETHVCETCDGQRLN